MKVKTRLGNFYLERTDHGISCVQFPSRLTSGRARDFFRGGRSNSAGLPQSSRAAKLLRDYFKGRRISFRSLKLDLSGRTAFERKILRVLSRIPWGQTRTYGWIAAKAGNPRAARAVGGVMRKNRLPILLPCHRVVAGNGGLGGYFRGLKWKKRLLAIEQIRYNAALAT